jgi:pyrophosphatase PpaX
VRLETVLFDLDGTLIDSGALILSSFRHATRTVLGRVIADDVLMANVGGHGLHAQMRALDEQHTDELVRVYREHNHAAYRAVRAFPGIHDLLERASARGRRLGVVTVKSRATTELTFELLSLGRFFGAVVTGDDTERHKPDPQPLLRALETLGASAESAAYVGDSPFDVEAAKAAGVLAVAVAWGGIHPRHRLEAEQPDLIVETPAELASVLEDDCRPAERGGSATA